MTQARQTVVLVSGLSGAGKASILRALEDVGYEAIDNLPIEMMEDLAGSPDPDRRLALGIDCRSRGFDADAVLAAIARLRSDPALRVELVFAWATDTVLLRRYTETRRRHPLSPQGRVADGILAEQTLTAALKESADFVVNTSDLPLGGLRQAIERRYGRDAVDEPLPTLAISLISFAFPSGLPAEAEIVFDARFLRNPHYEPVLRPLTGLEPEVGAYVESDPDFTAFYGKIVGLIDLLLPRFVQEGKKYVTIAVGCTGGRHRSVHIVEKLATYLTETGWHVSATHREIARERSSVQDRASRERMSGDRLPGDRAVTPDSPYTGSASEESGADGDGPPGEKIPVRPPVQAREA